MNIKKFYESVKLYEQQPGQQQPGQPPQQNQQQPPNQNNKPQQPPQGQQPAPAQQPTQGQQPPQQTQTQQQVNQQQQKPPTQPAPAQQPTQPAPAQSQQPVDQVSISANKDVSLAPDVALKTGTQATITPGDLSGNVTVQVGDKSYKVNDANIKQMLKTGDLSVVNTAESLSKKIKRIGF